MFKSTGKAQRRQKSVYHQYCCEQCGATQWRVIDKPFLNIECHTLIHSRPDLAAKLVNIQDGYNSASSSIKVKWRCDICGSIFESSITYMSQHNFHCPFCCGGISYPNRYMRSLLNQIGIEYQVEKQFVWSNKKRYDFFIPSLNTIIEMNGLQHYKQSYNGSWPDVAEIVKNDQYKRDIAIQNGIAYYIVVDSRNSYPKFIQASILKSKLTDLLDLSRINWQLVGCNSQTQLFRQIVQLWNSGQYTTTQISKIVHLGRNTTRNYLVRAAQVGLIDYDPTMQRLQINLKLHQDNKKKVRCINTGEVFESINEAAQAHGINRSSISNCLSGWSKSTSSKIFPDKKIYWEFVKE